MLIYWANGLFTEAQRGFNEVWARTLRARGHEIILPQEFDVNDPTVNPSALDLFLIDTEAVLRSDLVIAVIDDESIDAGVASEIGIAFASGIPLIGVYTDLRQHRSNGRMYKNLYVIGLLEASFGIVSTLDALHARVSAVESALAADKNPVQSLSADFDAFVKGLELSYTPEWSSYKVAADRASRWDCSVVIDIGCGTAVLAEFIRNPGGVTYLGYDHSPESINRARERASIGRLREAVLTSDVSELVVATREVDPENALLVMSFVLHDVRDLRDIRRVAETVPGARVLVEDLCPGDLPRLTDLLSRAAGKRSSVGVTDTRLGMDRLERLGRDIGFTVTCVDVVALECSFREPRDVIEYCDVFGLFEGQDVPVGSFLTDDQLRSSLMRVLSAESFPFIDRRLFVIVDATLA